MKRLILFALSISAFSLVSGQAVILDATQIDFGTVIYGDESSIDVEITNLLDVPVSVETVEFFDIYNSTPFFVVDMPEEIAVGSSATLTIHYAPVHNISHNSEAVIKTSGNRGAVRLDLLGNCTYPLAYYDAAYNLIDTDLKEAFTTLLADGYQELDYDAARDALFMQIENQMVNGQGSLENRITRAYLGTDAVGFVDREDAQSPPFNLNTEHTFPQSTFDENQPMRSDLHHLVITDIEANSIRGSLPFGTVESNVDWQEGGSERGDNAAGTEVFEPRDGHKGKTARALMYFILRYQNFDGFITDNQETTISEWNESFLPNEAEVNRNEDIFEFQGNRNPFIDYPQFADRIFSFRLDEDRPDVGVLSISSESVNFQDVDNEDIATFNLVLTNYGESFVLLSDIMLEENSTETFGFGIDIPVSLTILPGESVNLPITCEADNSADDLTAFLSFATNVTGENAYTLPVIASFVTAVADVNRDSDFLIFPNPFSSEISLTELDENVANIHVYDISGRLCAVYNGNSNTINTSFIQAGFYNFVITTEQGGRYSKEMVKY